MLKHCETYYGFDEKFEKRIYKYLCGRKIDLSELEIQYRFQTYSQWRDYVRNKYESYSYERLENFVCFLNQRMRDQKPFGKYWEMIIPITITIAINVLISLSIKDAVDCNGKLWIEILGVLIGVGGGTFLLCCTIMAGLNKLINSADKEYFYGDYIEILQDLLTKKYAEQVEKSNYTVK